MPPQSSSSTAGDETGEMRPSATVFMAGAEAASEKNATQAAN